jgi:hypothetical protein
VYAGRCCIVCLVLVSVPLAAACANPQADFDRAVAADLAGDEGKAFELYDAAARAGFARAQFNLGLMYESGRGTRADARAAALYYAFAAAAGSARAADRLAQLYLAGDGVPRNPQLATAWMRVAAGGRGRKSGLHTPPAPSPDSGLAAGAGMIPAAAEPVYPAQGAALPTNQDFVPLVWTASFQPACRFFIQLVAIAGTSMPLVLAETRDVSAIRAPIGRRPGQYAWRVFTFDQADGTYAYTPWQRFTIG